jgi:hypothetical protein
MRQLIVRFAMNFAAYLVFGGGIFAFAALQSHQTVDFGNVILAAVLVAFWSGSLTTTSETIARTMPSQAKRAAIAAVLGALSLGGFAALLSLFSSGGHDLRASFVVIGVVAGGAMHAARAFASGPRVDDDPQTSDQTT